MYRQKRRKYRNWIPAAIATASVALAVVLLLGYLGRNNDEPYQKVNTTDKVHQQEEEKGSASDESEEPEVNDKDNNIDDEMGVFQAYYLVKYDKDRICVYFSDRSGKITELEETSIVYETLSEDDQKRFEDGVKVENRNELNRILMDYES